MQIKEATEVIERNKEEDSKRFKNHKIEFDFTILVRIKEGMVDLSSDCIGSRRECNLRPWNSCWLDTVNYLWPCYKMLTSVCFSMLNSFYPQETREMGGETKSSILTSVTNPQTSPNN
ncbi:hypothetical protein GW17_00016169 [Ensete ventricosum]|nr:hypothetical protein GW17_00016169 [Ensete ventricosum]